MPHTRIIVNADDFGYDSKTNARIIECFDRKLISSASVMVTMPGFDDVVSWYRSEQDKPRLGIHLDLDEGTAVSVAFRRAYGSSKLFYTGRMLTCDSVYLNTIATELNAQIERFVASGIPLNHIDSHHHLHTHFPIARIAVALARKYEVVRLRSAGNVLYPAALHKRLYRLLLNGYFRWKYGRTDAPRFGHLDRFFAAKPIIQNTIVELMTHPGKDEDYNFLVSKKYAQFLSEYDLIT